MTTFPSSVKTTKDQHLTKSFVRYTGYFKVPCEPFHYDVQWDETKDVNEMSHRCFLHSITNLTKVSINVLLFRNCQIAKPNNSPNLG